MRKYVHSKYSVDDLCVFVEKYQRMAANTTLIHINNTSSDWIKPA